MSDVSTDLDVPGYTHSATEKKVENVESGDEMEYEEEKDETPRPSRLRYLSDSNVNVDDFYSCDFCDGSFPYYKDFQRHQLKHSEEQVKAMDLNKSGTPNPRPGLTELRFHSIELSDGSVVYPCLACDTPFKTHLERECHERRCYNKMYDTNFKEYTEASEDEDEDDAEPIWLRSGWYADNAPKNSENALDLLNNISDVGKKYELVEAGPYSRTRVCDGPIYHLNFKGKAKDCPSAHVETFFAQMMEPPSLEHDFCVSLGPSHELPRYKDADNRGCYFCRNSTIHHAVKKHEKLITGGSLWVLKPCEDYDTCSD